MAVRARRRALISLQESRQAAAVARSYRAYRGFSQDEMGLALLWPAGRYARIEQGRHRIHREHLDELLAHAVATEPALGQAFVALAYSPAAPPEEASA